MIEPDAITQPPPPNTTPSTGYCNFTAGAAPTATDDETTGYSENSFWYKATAPVKLWQCTENAEGAAVWKEIALTATFTLAEITGTLSIAKGGTGQTTAALAFGALSPLTTKGDLLGFSTQNVRVPVGTDGQFLVADSTATRGLRWETLATGITIGSTAITGGADGRVLFQAAGVVSQSGNFTFDGATLKVQATNLAQTANIFEAIRYDGAVGFRVDDDTSVTLGGAFDYANGKHAAQHIVQYSSGGIYNGKGFLLSDLLTGSKVRLHAFNNGLYLTDNAGTAAPLTLGTRANPDDGSLFTASSGRWIINSGAFIVNNATWTGNHQLESYSTSLPQFAAIYDTSNYATISVASNGAATFNAAGAGAKFIFADDVELSDAKNIILNTTTGTKIGTSSTQKLSFFNATPVTQRSNIGEITDSTGGTRPSTIAAFSAAFTASEFNDALSTVIQRLNRIESVFQELGLTA